MGLFTKHTCAVCGKKLGLNRYGIGPKQEEWICPACFKAAGGERVLIPRKMDAQTVKSYALNKGVYIEEIPSTPYLYQVKEEDELLVDYHSFGYDPIHKTFACASILCDGDRRALPLEQFDKAVVRRNRKRISTDDWESFKDFLVKEYIDEQTPSAPTGSYAQSPSLDPFEIELYLVNQDKPMCIVKPIAKKIPSGTKHSKKICDDLSYFLDVLDEMLRDKQN